MLSYTAEPVGVVFRFVTLVFFLMLILTGLIRTERIVRELPSALSDTFDGVVLKNDTLHSENGLVVPKQWQLQELSSVITGRTVPVEMLPETTLTVNPEGNFNSGIVFSRDSIYLNILPVENSEPETKSYAWKDIASFYTGEKGFDVQTIVDDYTFFAAVSNQYWPLDNLRYLTSTMFYTFVIRGEFDSKTTWLSDYFKGSRVGTFGLVLQITLSLIFEDALKYIFMLWILILIYRRELSQVWVKRSTLKILLNGTIPYLILMPVFALAGHRSDLLNTVALVSSAVIISRAFRHHRLSIIAVKKEKEE